MGEGWRSEWLARLPTKIADGRVLIHNRVQPPDLHTKPGVDGFFAWIFHPAGSRRALGIPLEACSCGWMPELGSHYIFPGDSDLRDPDPDLRVEDLLSRKPKAVSKGSDWLARDNSFRILTGTFGGSGGDAFLVAPDGSVCGLVWERPDAIYFEEVQPPESGRIWMSEAFDDPELLRHHLPGLWEQWEAWRGIESQ